MSNQIWKVRKRHLGGYRAYYTNAHGFRLYASVDAGWREEDFSGPDQPSAFTVVKRGQQVASGYCLTLKEAQGKALQTAANLSAGQTPPAGVDF